MNDRGCWVGIDPGKSGGLAVIYVADGEVRYISMTGMPPTERDTIDWLHANTIQGSTCFAVLEKVTGFMGGQDNRWLGPAMFKLGESYGFLKGCLTGVEFPFQEVTPRTWQRALGIRSKKRGESKTAWKNHLKQTAQRLYPSKIITLATSDALLIATYCQRLRGGLLNERSITNDAVNV
jgi:hypothetical protein